MKKKPTKLLNYIPDYVNYGSSLITSKVRQIISVMKTETLVFPEK